MGVLPAVRITMGSRSLFIQDLMIDIYMITGGEKLGKRHRFIPETRNRQKHQESSGKKWFLK